MAPPPGSDGRQVTHSRQIPPAGVLHVIVMAIASVVLQAFGRAWRKAGWLPRLLRIQNCLAAALATWLGARLAVPTEPDAMARLVTAAIVAALAVAASNAFNDLRDARVDGIAKASRPLPSGQVSPRTASILTAGLAGAAIVAAWSLGWAAGALATALLALGLAYSVFLKGTVAIGNAAVGLLSGCTVLYGGMAVGRLTWTSLYGASIVVLFILAGEILKTIADRDADAAAGFHTLGTRLADREAKLAYVFVAAAMVAAAIAPWLVGLASTTYLLVAMPAAVTPTAGVVILLYRWPRSRRSLHAALWLTKAAWFSGLLALTLLS